MDETVEMLRALTDAPGVPGQERAVRDVMRRYLEPFADVSVDHLGSIIGRKVGQAHGPKIMLAGHMDEIGFMVTRITDEGFLKFQPLGGWWSQVMLAQRVAVYTRTGPILGVIGSKPPHILTDEEKQKPADKKAMFIDVGAASRVEAEAWGIRPGAMVVPDAPWTPLHNPRLLMAKAWDNRFGCALAIEVLRRLQGTDHPNVVYGVGTVQEEVGLRGATTSTQLIGPDIGFAFDTSIAGDMPGMTPDDAAGKLGQGPVILLYDGSLVPHTGLRDLVLEVAEHEGIPIQFDRVAGGGTDAGKIQLYGAGVPSLVVGVAVRYIHTHAAILHRDDFDQAARLMTAVVKRLDTATLTQLRA